MRPRSFKRVIFYIIFLLLFQVILSYTIVYELTVSRMRGTLETYAKRISQDLQYENGKWNTAKYLADPLTPHPTGSSGYVRPLYIIGVDGFIIERSNPITGYLDVSDIKHLLAFQNIQTLNTVTNERWRVVTTPITKNGTLYGVITASYFNPQVNDLTEIDAKLTGNVNRLLSLITVDEKTGNVDVSRVDIRGVNYDVSFEVVNKYNKVLINNGRTPSFIDTSYVIDQIYAKPYDIISDKKTHEPFLIHRMIITSGSQPVGLIVTGDSMKNVFNILNTYLVISELTMILVLIPLAYITVKTLKKEHDNDTPKVKTISFDRKNSVLRIDDREIQIPYASNQFYILDALFSNPKKRWENDELLEKLGEEEIGNSRAVYDAAIAVNKKAKLKLIEYSDKTYRVNPAYVNQLQKA